METPPETQTKPEENSFTYKKINTKGRKTKRHQKKEPSLKLKTAKELKRD